jgi:hypothetical protein
MGEDGARLPGYQLRFSALREWEDGISPLRLLLPLALFRGWLGDQQYWRRFPFPHICSAAIFFRGLAASKHPALAPNNKDKEKPKV